MKIADLIDAMERIAPPRLAEPWDNVGLLMGSRDAEVHGPVLLTIDLTEAVADEAVRLKCGAVMAYHPPIFEPIKSITCETEAGRVALKLLRAGIAVYSPHTALDAASGGMTDWLADGLLGPSDAGGGGDRRALRSCAELPPTQELKVITFVPQDKLDDVRKAMATGGAGIIGNYEVCSFNSAGHGTFLGGDGSRPAVGEPGKLESVAEHRLEMVCSRRALALVIETLKRFQPYEEPAFDVYELAPQPGRAVGAGRRITLDHAAPIEELAARLKKHLGISVVQIGVAAGMDACGSGGGAASGGRAEDQLISRIALCPGAGGSLVPLALEANCQLFVTGEMKHHEIRAAIASGLSVMLAGHTQTERPFLKLLAPRLSKELGGGGVKVLVSVEDREPWIAR